VEPAGCGTRRTVVRVAFAAVAVLALVLTSATPAAPASSGGDGLEGRVEVGFDGLVVRGLPTPVLVTLSADRLVSGEVGVRLGDFAPTEFLDFEIAGGAEEEHWLLLSTPSSQMGGLRASAQVDGERVALASSPFEADPDALLLGVLSGLGSGGGGGDGVDTRFGLQEIHRVVLAPGLLDLGASALAALDAIAVTPDDIAALPDAHVDAIVGWLSLGGTLYVDADPGPLSNWPDELQPSASVVRAGSGSVVATGGGLAAGRWSELISPAPHRSAVEDGIVAQTLPMHDASSDLLSVDLGRDLPQLRGLLVIFGIYVVLVGPVAYLLLRRRVMARWVVIPALAVLATGAIYVGADGPGADASASIVSVIETGPGPAMATTKVAMATDAGGESISAPPGWAAATDDGMGMGMVMGPGFEIGQRRGVADTEIDVPAAAGGVGILGAQGPVDFDGGLEIEAVAVDDGVVRGTVTNTTGVELSEVGVFAGRSSGSNVGTLAAGESVAFELTDTNQFTFGADPFTDVWPNGVALGRAMSVDQGDVGFGGGMECDAQTGECVQFGPAVMNCVGPGCGTGLPGIAHVPSALRPRGVNALANGLITAVGWTSELDAPVGVGANVQIVDIRTAVVSRAAVQVPGESMVDSAPLRTLVSAEQGPDGLLEMVYRFQLPDQIGGRPPDPARLRMDPPPVFRRIEVLTPSGPHVVRDEETGVGIVDGDPRARPEAVVPPEALVDGQVFVRVKMEVVAPGPGREMVVYEADA
jgi:hypothetical protein